MNFSIMTLGGDGGLIDGLLHLILPATVLGVANAGALTRYVRSSMLEVLGQDYVRTARAKGLIDALVLRKHALRNALIPVITLAGLQLPAVLGGAVITEQVFNIPGVGRLLVQSVLRRDYPVVQGAMILVATTFVLVNLLTDVAYALFDPRIRYE